jgi:dephospho-CoA kinase
MILRVGLTGGIASGKSTITRIMGGLGCVTIDADEVVARLYRPGGLGFQALVEAYGREVVQPDGQIDRKRVADIAFASAEAARKLNALIHPLVVAEENRIMAAEAARFPDRDRIFVVEATLLLEAGGRKRYDRVIVVDIDPKTQVQRAMERGMTEEEVTRRIRYQMPREERLRDADYVIDNSGDRRSAEMQAHQVYEKLRADLETKKKGAGLRRPPQNFQTND